jgi:hypothetical protein
MQLRKLLEQWDLTSPKIKAPFLDMEWQPRDEDKDAAWDHDLFALTRSTIKRHGRQCINFTRIAVVMLNQKVRPFTAKWHGQVSAGTLSDADRSAFRQELSRLQQDLRNYTRLLADLAGVEDLTDLEDV